jgi:hypothetical protein
MSFGDLFSIFHYGPFGIWELLPQVRRLKFTYAFRSRRLFNQNKTKQRLFNITFKAPVKVFGNSLEHTLLRQDSLLFNH